MNSDNNILLGQLDQSLQRLNSMANQITCDTYLKKQICNQFNWYKKKITLIDNANNGTPDIPIGFLPKKIYNTRYETIKKKEASVSNYYLPSIYDTDKNHYLNEKIPSIDKEEIFSIASLTSLMPNNVVHAEFGFNIGVEFGGNHMAIILRNFGQSLLVIPMSTQEPSANSRKHVEIVRKYGFRNSRRTWVNVGKIQLISIHRIDFAERPPHIHKEELEKIRKAALENNFFAF